MGNQLYEQRYYNAFMQRIGNVYGVCGLMGNLEQESNLTPFRKQGDMNYNDGYPESVAYTEKVDNGTYTESEFVNDSIGYGLAQWTFYTRKQGLYNMKKERGCSIGDFDLSVDYLMHELETGYIDVLNVLKNAKSLREASDKVLHDYESPKDQSEAVELERLALSKAIYDKYANSEVPDTPVTPETPTQKKKKMPIWFYLRKVG